MNSRIESKMATCLGYSLSGVKCKLTFTQVDFIEHRKHGFCSKDCQEGFIKVNKNREATVK